MTIKNKVALAMEAISFQNDQLLYKELVAALTPVVQGRIRSAKELRDLPIAGIIKHHTGLTITMNYGDFVNAYIEPAILDINNPLMVIFRGYGEAAMKEVQVSEKRVIKAGSKGTIDLANGKVTGVFANLVMPMTVGSGLWTSAGLSAEEVAAVIAHEIGHAFTWLETIMKTVTCNMAIQSAVQALGPADSMEHRLQIVHEAQRRGNFRVEDERALADPSMKKQVFETVLIRSALSDILYSAANSTVYDMRSSEFMADQWATRQGFARPLVTALDKIHSYDPSYRRGLTMHLIVQALTTAFVIVASIANPLIGLFAVLLLFLPGLDHDVYDRPGERYARIKRDLIQTIKSPNLATATREAILKDLEVINKVMADVKDREGWFTLLWSSLTGNRRNNKRQIQFQQELEKLINTELFASASQLRVLSSK